MAKGLAPIFFTACGVVVAGIIGYSLIEPSIKSAPQKASETAPLIAEQKPIEAEDSDEQTTKLVILDAPHKKSSKSDVEPEKVEITELKFDLIRVEKDGSTVIAGQGPGNEIVELIDDSKMLARTTISSTGEFVFVLDEPLEPGTHELFLRVTPKNGSPILSSSFAFVDVPKPKTIDPVTVLLAEAGKPSKLLQKPVVEKNIVTATTQFSLALKKPEVEAEDNDIKKKDVSLTTQPKTIVESKLAPVLIEAADVEAGKIFIAGTGEPRTSVSIYLENEFLGTAKIADNGAFLFEANRELEAGRHNIRADMVKGTGVDVLARAEVTLVHEPKIVKVEPPKKIKVVEEEKPEPDLETISKPNETASVKPPKEPELEIVADVQSEQEVGEEAKSEVPETEKKEIQTGSAVIIRRGDNLWTVARRNYGAGIRYTTIFDANRDQVRNPHRIYPGQVLKVPDNNQSVQ